MDTASRNHHSPVFEHPRSAALVSNEFSSAPLFTVAESTTEAPVTPSKPERPFATTNTTPVRTPEPTSPATVWNSPMSSTTAATSPHTTTRSTTHSSTSPAGWRRPHGSPAGWKRPRGSPAGWKRPKGCPAGWRQGPGSPANWSVHEFGPHPQQQTPQTPQQRNPQHPQHHPTAPPASLDLPGLNASSSVGRPRRSFQAPVAERRTSSGDFMAQTSRYM